ncbi:MAG TPA: hypothetical protein ENF21_09800 [Bacteroidetes bacterium]|nr:hypothetical protein [Bacteroidota bacterium]
MHKCLIILCCLFLSGRIMGQTRSEMREIFVEAESHYLYREYEDAILLYLLLEDDDNANILYKIGVCYLHIPNEKEKAIPYLEKAVKNAAYDARDHLPTETRAPLDAYFYLGNAYRITNQLDKAIATYQHFRELIRQNNPMENDEFINQQIRACEIAKELKKNPVSYIPQNLGNQVNVVSMNIHPAVSGDENTLVFTAKYGDEDVLYQTSRTTGGVWSPAEDITRLVHSDRDGMSSSLSFDGTELYLYKSDMEDGNIYVSSRKNGEWTRARKLNRNINTRYYESHACVSSDGNTLYFTSNRTGGLGELDIYVSKKDKRGNWGPAENIGNNINTPFNENYPFITENDSLLYFSSEGHYNMGGYDIFYSQRMPDGSWSKPVNIGYPLNTTDDDLFFNPVQNGKAAYISMLDGYKEMNLYRIEILPEGITRDFTIRGQLSLADTTREFGWDFQIFMIDRESMDTVDVGFPNRQSGQYSFITKSGNYDMIYTGNGYLPHREEIRIDEYARKSEFIIDVELTPAEPSKKPVREKWLKDSIDISQARPLDSAMVITGLDIQDLEIIDHEREVLYYTVQLMALKVRPVDVSYFAPLENVRVILGKDGFYRYTYGEFDTQEEAEKVRQQLVDKGYHEDLWVKKVYQESD